MASNVLRGWHSAAVVWFHMAIAAVAGLIYLALSRGAHVSTELFVNRNSEAIFVFIAGGFAANVVAALPLLRRGRKKARWGICRQFAVLCFACLPFCGAIYYTRKLSSLDSRDDISEHNSHVQGCR